MQSMPIVWEQTVSRTLRDLRLQKDVVESVLSPDDLSFPSLLQSGLICTRLGTTTGLIMERVEGSGNDSGWFCGCYDADHDHNDAAELKCVSLYEAAVCYRAANSALPGIAFRHIVERLRWHSDNQFEW